PGRCPARLAGLIARGSEDVKGRKAGCCAHGANVCNGWKANIRITFVPGEGTVGPGPAPEPYQPGLAAFRAARSVAFSAISLARIFSLCSLRAAISVQLASDRSQRSRTLSSVAALAIARASAARSR